MAEESYPTIIRRLPKADIPFPGIEGWLAQGEAFQVVYFEIKSPSSVAPHSHGAQFGIILKGEMSLTIEGKTLSYRKGDTYFIPTGAVHQAEFHTPAQTVDFFAEPHRYKTKNR
ncbi:MAG: cupin domain-containing protein [Candidatus Heimdallarchaeota archaeon]